MPLIAAAGSSNSSANMLGKNETLSIDKKDDHAEPRQMSDSDAILYFSSLCLFMLIIVIADKWRKK